MTLGKWTKLAALVAILAGTVSCRTGSILTPATVPSYDDISFRGFAEEALHRLVMPHARITTKRSGCVSPAALAAFLAEARDLTPQRASAPREDGCLAFVEAGEMQSSQVGCYAADGQPELERIGEALDRLSKDLVLTYSSHPPLLD